jgi:phosphoglycerate dehydrogenase-like enzyme
VGGAVALPFRVGVTRDIRGPDGSLVFAPVGLEALERAGLAWEFLADDVPELTPELIEGYDGLYHFSPRVTRASLEGVKRLAVLARHGVGLDVIDVDACTENGIAVTVTPEGVRRPMASAALALMLALAHRLVERNAAFHAGRWQDGRFALIGAGLSDRTLGVIGFGSIGRELVRLVRPFGMRVLVTTPRLTRGEELEHGVARVALETLLEESDFVVVACPLTPETYRMLDARRLALMKPSAFLINVARGAIVDQGALVAALRTGRLAGAGLDVFEHEPVPSGDPLVGLPNVVAAPHALGYTEELFGSCVRGACAAIVAVARGEVPPSLVNPAVAESAAFRDKLRRFARSRVP